MALVLALLSAAFYGTADFLGGVAARRAPALAATVAAQGCGLVVVLLAMPLFAGEQLILQSHYANASGSDITGQVDVDITTIPHSQVVDYLETALVLDTGFAIPPMTKPMMMTVTATQEAGRP